MPCQGTTSTLPLLGCCEQLGGPICIRMRQMRAVRRAPFHTFCEGSCPPGTPMRFFLTSTQTFFCTPGSINRYTYEGVPPCAVLSLDSVSDEVLPSEIWDEVRALYDTPWPDPPSLLNNQGQFALRWFLDPFYNSTGGVVMPEHVPNAVWDNGPLIACPVSFYTGGDGVGQFEAENDDTWWPNLNQGGTVGIQKAKAQLYHENAGFTGCLYDQLAFTTGVPVKENCRTISVPSHTWIDVPAPAFGYATYFDPQCTCV